MSSLHLCSIIYFLLGETIYTTFDVFVTAVYSCLDYYPGYPYWANTNDIEITDLLLYHIPQYLEYVGPLHCSVEYPVVPFLDSRQSLPVVCFHDGR